MIIDIMAKKGNTAADLTSAEKMMTEGCSMVPKGESMMTGGTMAEGRAKAQASKCRSTRGWPG